MATRRPLLPGEYGYCSRAVPDLHVNAPGDLNPVHLRETHGIVAWILDIDGTFVPRLKDDEPLSEGDEQFVTAVSSGGLCSVIGTNRDSEWHGISFPTSNPLSKLKVFFGDNYQKPQRGFFNPIIDYFDGIGIRMDNVAVIGDGLAHDIAGANSLGLFSVLVDRLAPEEFEDFTQTDNDW